MLTQDQILNLIISEDQTSSVPPQVRENEDYQEYKKIWDLCDVLAESERTSDLDDAWTSISHWMESDESRSVQRSDQSPPQTSGRIVLMRSERWAIAASFLLVLGSALYLLRPQDPYMTVMAGLGTEVVLPDGTKANLSSDAQVKYLKEESFLAGTDRVVYLEGEAIFDVVSDPSKPFKVVTDGTSVDVLGTVFRYKADGEYSESENVEGLVKFSVNETPDVAKVLNPGDKISYDGEDLTFTPATPPPPPPTPRNKVGILDLIDILGDRFPVQLEFPGNMNYNRAVIEVDLRGNLSSIIQDLEQNENLQITAHKGRKQGHYLLSSLLGNSTELKSDYSFEHYIEQIPLNGQGK